jgi:indolepyruvate ferredoxin oxidoreductase beta subunit
MINAVMLGAIAGCGQLPIAPEVFEAAIREDGKAVESNLRGFRAGLEAARRASAGSVVEASAKRRRGAVSLASLEQDVTALPVAAREIAAEGVRRLAAYQDTSYAALYLERLRQIGRADAQCGADGQLVRETARQLAVRMSYEDVIRVAQAKIDPERMRRIETSMAAPNAVLVVTEFLKPGIEEFCSLLPPRLARRVLSISERRGWLDRYHWGMGSRPPRSTATCGSGCWRNSAAGGRGRSDTAKSRHRSRLGSPW